MEQAPHFFLGCESPRIIHHGTLFFSTIPRRDIIGHIMSSGLIFVFQYKAWRSWHTQNLRSWEAEVAGLRIQGQPGLHRETLSKEAWSPDLGCVLLPCQPSIVRTWRVEFQFALYLGAQVKHVHTHRGLMFAPCLLSWSMFVSSGFLCCYREARLCSHRGSQQQLTGRTGSSWAHIQAADKSEIYGFNLAATWI